MNQSYNRISVVPWRTREEFCKVHEYLYSDSIKNKRVAVEQIAVWESRCHPALPTAIDATNRLVRAVIQDLLFEVDQSLCQAEEIRMMYAMAIIRFVSVVLECDQNGFKKQRLMVLAEMKGIPDWVVELRQDAIHSYVPSLPALRMGAKFALQYLKKSFWEEESSNIQPVKLVSSGKKQKMLELINQYRKMQYQRLYDSEMKESLSSDYMAIMKKFRSYLNTSKKEFIDVLVKPNVFICPEDVMKSLQDSVSSYLKVEDDLSLPIDLENLWIGLIKIIHLYDAIPMFLQKLLLSQQTCHIPVCQKIAAAWAVRIFLATSSHNPKSRLERMFNKKGALFNLYELLYACMKGGNMYLVHAFDVIVSRTGNKTRFAELYLTMGLYQGCFLERKSMDEQQGAARNSSKRSKDTMEEIFFTLEDAEEDINEVKAKRSKLGKNPWSLAPASIPWKDIPLGAILDPNNKEDAIEEIQVEAIPVKEERFILVNENDNKEITSLEKDTPDDSWMETFRPDKFDMVYRRRKN